MKIAINFRSSKDFDPKQVMHLKSDNIEDITYDNANEIWKNILNHFYQDINLVKKQQ